MSVFTTGNSGGKEAHPDSVKRVNPPRTTIPNTRPAEPISQYPTALLLVTGHALLFTFFNAIDEARLPSGVPVASAGIVAWRGFEESENGRDCVFERISRAIEVELRGRFVQLEIDEVLGMLWRARRRAALPDLRAESIGENAIVEDGGDK